MRIIKFRAWDKRRKKMVGTDYPDNWDEDFDEAYADEVQMMLTGIEELAKNENFVVMQSTGQRDKNGKNIYEGDIVKIDGENSIYIVRFGEFAPCGKGYDVIGWYLEECNDMGSELSLLGFNLKNVEVIGNIYENPDLLNNGIE